MVKRFVSPWKWRGWDMLNTDTSLGAPVFSLTEKDQMMLADYYYWISVHPRDRGVGREGHERQGLASKGIIFLAVVFGFPIGVRSVSEHQLSDVTPFEKVVMLRSTKWEQLFLSHVRRKPLVQNPAVFSSSLFCQAGYEKI
uniref:Ycf15 n=1 Tax=Heterorhabditis bacteriophora TaxID=37862 RepID=A0A1I7X1M1_HETBA